MDGFSGGLKLHLVDLARNTRALPMYRELLRSEWYAPERIHELQWERLKALLQHACAKVPYYRDLFRRIGAQPEDIRSDEDFRRIPVLTKEIIRREFDRLQAEDRRRYHPHPKRTGGSTGTPLRYWIDSRSHSAGWAIQYRFWHTGGWRPGDRMVLLGGGAIAVNGSPLKQRIYNTLNDWLSLGGSSISPETVELWLPRIRTFGARFLFGYPSTAYLLATMIEEKGLTPPRFRSVFTTSEVLQPKYRSTIERVFSCEVFDTYGGFDGSGFAGECPAHSGLHLAAETAFLEILDEEGKPAPPGTVGEVVSTDLYNYAMPFIRYRVGDLAAFAEKPCTCGRGLPLIREIRGRTNDFVTAISGERVHASYFSRLVRDIPWIGQFYVEQERRDGLVMYVKDEKAHSAGTEPSGAESFEDDLRRIRRELEKKFAGMNIEIRKTDRIPTTPLGKHRYIVNRIGDGGDSAGGAS